jgi:hypothetical protein
MGVPRPGIRCGMFRRETGEEHVIRQFSREPSSVQARWIKYLEDSLTNTTGLFYVEILRSFISSSSGQFQCSCQSRLCAYCPIYTSRRCGVDSSTGMGAKACELFERYVACAGIDSR